MIRLPARPFAVLVLAALSGCAPASEPYHLPAARLDPAMAVRAGASAEPPSAAASARPATSFEERLRRSRGDDAGAAQPSAAETVTHQGVRLPQGLMADLPQRLGAWSWSGDDGLVLAVYEQNGRAEALVYAQPQPADRPAAAMNRFLYAVDPGLASEWLLAGSAVGPLAAQAAAGLPLSPREAARAVTALATPTLGRGLGYDSRHGSFSGWRWVGENEHGVYLRLARSEGVWGPQAEPSEEVRVLAGRVAAEVPQLQNLLGERPPAASPETSAWLLLGSATHRGRTLHLALLCRTDPVCPVSDDLAGVLSSLRTAEPSLRTAPGPRAPWELAARVGLQLHAVDPALAQAAVAALRPAAPPAGAGEP